MLLLMIDYHLSTSHNATCLGRSLFYVFLNNEQKGEHTYIRKAR